MADGFAAGDVVYLASGGPPMTVWEAREGGPKCVWFAGSSLEEGTFPGAVLRRFAGPVRVSPPEVFPGEAAWVAADGKPAKPAGGIKPAAGT